MATKYDTQINPSGMSLDTFEDDHLRKKAKVITCGNVIHVSIHDNRLDVKHEQTTKRISKTEYVDLRTMEVKEYHQSESREECRESVKKTMAMIRDLVSTNTTEPEKCRWITLTYADNMTDPERLYRDFQKFIQRMRRKFGKFEYIAIAEPQGRGAWHMHIITIHPEKAPYMANQSVSESWGQGFVKVKALDPMNDNIGAYLSAYLGDVELSETDISEQDLESAGYKIHEAEVIDLDGKKIKKKFVKGFRLHMYPIGMNIVRTSRGIKRPEVEIMSTAEAKKKASAATLAFSRITTISDNHFSNRICYFQYNTKRRAYAHERSENTQKTPENHQSMHMQNRKE